jgi:hypothetical protein
LAGKEEFRREGLAGKEVLEREGLAGKEVLGRDGLVGKGLVRLSTGLLKLMLEDLRLFKLLE